MCQLAGQSLSIAHGIFAEAAGGSRKIERCSHLGTSQAQTARFGELFPQHGRRLKKLTTQGKSHTPRCQMGHSQPAVEHSHPQSNNATTANLTALPSLRNRQRLPTHHVRDHHDRAAMRAPASPTPPLPDTPPLVPTVPSTTADQPVNTVQAIRPRRKQYLDETGDISIGGLLPLRLHRTAAPVTCRCTVFYCTLPACLAKTSQTQRGGTAAWWEAWVGANVAKAESAESGERR